MTRIGAGLSTAPEAASAVREAAASARATAERDGVDLAFLFLTPEHLDAVDDAVAALDDALEPRHLLGCVAQGVLAGEREHERGPAAAVWAGSFPGADVRTFHLEASERGDDLEIRGLPDLGEPELVALLVDPFTFPADAFVAAMGEAHPDVPLVGGLAVGGRGPHAQALVVDGAVHPGGAVGAAIAGVDARVVVSQGCAPVGREAVVTEADGNVILALAGEPALERLQHELEELGPRDRELASHGILVGLVIDENRPEYERGDFLMRGILGADRDTGGLAVGEEVRIGQTVRFHVRDARTAGEDLAAALGEALRSPSGPPAGALLFTCNGRGTQMFDRPDHDACAVSAALAAPGVAGFFCGGEIGPVGHRSFLHGFTATMAVFFDEP